MLVHHEALTEGGKEVFLFNHTLNTFYFWLYGFRHMVKDLSAKGNLLEGTLTKLYRVVKLASKKEMFYLAMHSTHFSLVIWSGAYSNIYLIFSALLSCVKISSLPHSLQIL